VQESAHHAIAEHPKSALENERRRPLTTAGSIDLGATPGQGDSCSRAMPSVRLAGFRPASGTHMPKRSTFCLLSAFVGAAALGACGSRTPLDVVPTLDEVNPTDASVVLDSGLDVNIPLGCFIGSRPVGQIPIDLYFVLDRSRSMQTIDRGATQTRWASISAALDVFFNAPLSNGLGAGIMFFPRTAALGSMALCSTGDYAFPVVPIGTLPGVAPSILTAISVQILASGTPMTPALEGAHVYARSVQVSQGNHTLAVVLVTDGAPRDCGSTVPATSAVAAAAIAGAPPIKTYVLGVGPNLSNLNAIAQAGGTSQAYLVESSGEGSLLAALEAIRTSALACEFVLPLAGGQPPNLDVVRVSTRLGMGGGPMSIDQVAGAEACAGRPGWFYDNPLVSGQAPPTKIVLCPASCDPLVQSIGNHLDVTINCPTP